MNPTFIISFIFPVLLTFVPILVLAFAFQESYMTLFMLLILSVVEQGAIYLSFSDPASDIPLLFIMSILDIYLILKMIESRIK